MLTGKRLTLRKEAKISVYLQRSPCVCTHEQESKFFRFEKKEEEEGNDNDGIATTIHCTPVITTNIVDRYFSSHIRDRRRRRKWWYKKLSTSVFRGKTKKREKEIKKKRKNISQEKWDYKNDLETICLQLNMFSRMFWIWLLTVCLCLEPSKHAWTTVGIGGTGTHISNNSKLLFLFKNKMMKKTITFEKSLFVFIL